jgi:biopolymer transport protein ExbD
VTVVNEPEVKHGRSMEVLNALAVAGISNVTFTFSEED